MPDQEIVFVPLSDTQDAHELHQSLVELGLPVSRLAAGQIGLLASAPEPPSMVVIRVSEVSVALVEMVRQIHDQDLPIQVILDKITEDEEVTLLHSGVLEVLSDSASARLTCSRVSALYRHLKVGWHREGPTESYEFGELMVDVPRREARINGVPLGLTRTEFDLLTILVREPERVFSRASLQTDVAGAPSVGDRSLESHLSRLRTKIQKAGGPRLVEAVRGIGYRLGA